MNLQQINAKIQGQSFYSKNKKMKVRCFWHSKLSEKQYKPNYDTHSANKTKKLDEVLKLDKVSITYSKQSILDQLLNRLKRILL